MNLRPGPGHLGPVYEQTNFYIFMKQIYLSILMPAVLACSAPDGPDGPQGSAGDPGKNGINGVNGPTGAKGQTGEKGSIGPQGAAGPQGPSGTLNAYLSGWRELDWQFEDEDSEDGEREVLFMTTFEEKSLTKTALKSGTLKVFMRETGSVAGHNVRVIAGEIWYSGKLADNATAYQIKYTVEEGIVTVGIALLTRSSESVETLKQKLQSSKIAFQTYILHP